MNRMQPVAIAARLRGLPGRVLLHSGSDSDKLGRYSFVSAMPLAEIVQHGPDAWVRHGSGPAQAIDAKRVVDTVEVMATEMGAGQEAAAGSPPLPVAMGYMGYPVGRALLGLPDRPIDGQREPDLYFGIYGAVYRFDHATGLGEVVGCDERARRDLAQAIGRDVGDQAALPRIGPLASDEAGEVAYRRGFAAVAEYLRAGDIYQVNLARQLIAKVEAAGDALALYRALCEYSPAPCGAVIEGHADWSILSLSPERFLSRQPGQHRLETRPIKGTRRRTGDRTGDRLLAGELSADAKEAAEHLMIVDLERNDLGRICQIGSVRVDSFARVVELPTLLHLVSTVSGELRPEVGFAEIVRATFPGGSITGAPKLRAMEIIDELEPFDRGVYTGAIGYLGQGGALDLSIAIRTATLGPDQLRLCVGGGLVADSTLARELEETEEKAAAWRAVLGALDG